MILVTGAMGRIGSATVRLLRQKNLPVRALIPARHRVPWLSELGAELVEASCDEADRLLSALAGVQQVVLIARPSVEQVAVQQQLIDLCVQAGIQRVVLLSVAGASADAGADITRRHWRIEEHLRQSPQEHAIVRPVRLMQELQHHLPLLVSQQMLVGCQGDGAVPDVDAHDVGGVLAGLVTASRLPTGPVLVTGGVAYTRPEVAAVLSRAWHQPLHYVPCTPLDLTQTLLASGLPRWRVQELVSFEEAARDGRFAAVTDAVREWTGHAPRPLPDFADELARVVRYGTPPAAAQSATWRSTRSR